MTCRGIVAIAIAEIPVILFADFSPPPHKIGAIVVFTDHQVMVPSGFISGFPSDQRFMAIWARMFIDHGYIPPNHSIDEKLRSEPGMSIKLRPVPHWKREKEDFGKSLTDPGASC
jgi:hypothetical protein